MIICMNFFTSILLRNFHVHFLYIYFFFRLVYDIDFGKVIDSIRGHEDAVSSVCWGDSTRCLVTSSWDCSVKVWRGMYQGSKWHRLKATTLIRIDRDSRFTCASINRLIKFKKTEIEI